ncbi:nephrin-like [Penaeus indicus]|uniref:nephrin-like n=1 Tax=Penaeus chinensis TaxID=139456 RepID=UPI001FB7BFA1|nr:nephrin-like [Penaeus chinensis]
MGGFGVWMYLLLFCSVYGVSALQITSIFVPRTARSGDTVRLTCNFELNGDELYSLAWWKDDKMFYTFISKNEPPKAVYNAPGITVDHEASGLYEVILSHVDHRASGKLRCEVVADYPSFEQDTMDANMTVIEEPLKGPSITGNENRSAYRVGDLLLLNCSSTFSYPPTTLSWDIDGHKVSQETVVVYPGEVDAEGRETSKSGLQMRLRREHFRQGVLVLRCISTILHMYRRSAQTTIIDADHIQSSPRESASTAGAGSPSLLRVLLLLLLLLSLLGT